MYTNIFHCHIDLLRSQEGHSKPDDDILKPPLLVSQVASSPESTTIDTAHSLNFDLEAVADSSVADIMDEDEAFLLAIQKSRRSVS